MSRYPSNHLYWHPSNRLYYNDLADVRDALECLMAQHDLEMSHIQLDDPDGQARMDSLAECNRQASECLSQRDALMEEAGWSRPDSRLEELYRKWAASKLEWTRRIGDACLERDWSGLAV